MLFFNASFINSFNFIEIYETMYIYPSKWSRSNITFGVHGELMKFDSGMFNQDKLYSIVKSGFEEGD